MVKTWQKKMRLSLNLKKIILGVHKSFYGVVFLSIFFLSKDLEASTHPREFVEITGENILYNHNLLKTSVNDCYDKIEKDLKVYFNPGKKWEEVGNFDLKKGVNLCAAGVEWIQQHDDKFYITEFQPIISKKTGKKLIFSNTSTDQWNNNIISEEYQILSWPYTKRLEVYDFNFLDEQKNIILNCFKRGKLTRSVYLSEILPNSLRKYESYKDPRSLETDLQAELSYTKGKYSLSLDKTIGEYKDLFQRQQDPVSFIKENEYLKKYIMEEVDFKHSEPLVCWWISKNLMLPPKIEGLKTIFPIISIYTERQTCSIPCEEIIQRSANNKRYIPLISFNSDYEKNKYILLESHLLKMPEGSDFHIPYSTIEPNLRMSFQNLENNIKISAPYTIDWTAIKAIQPSIIPSDESEKPWEKIVRFPIQFKF